MITTEQKLIEEKERTREFLEKLGRLVCEYRTEIPLGPLLGAMDIIKLRLFYDANEVRETAEKVKGQE